MADRTDSGLTDVLWAIVLLQGGIGLTTTLEALVGGLGFGAPATVPIVSLSLAGAVLALASARGLRRRKRWARRVTLVAEWLLLAVGLLNVLATILMAEMLPGPVPILTTILTPIAVMILLRRSKGEFVAEPVGVG